MDIISELRRRVAENEPTSRPLKEAQAMTLMEEFARYSQPCPFKPGDLVTQRATSTYTNHGEPHIVLEVLDQPIRNLDIGSNIQNVASYFFGNRLDIRIAVIGDEGVVLPFLQEIWMLEPYTGPRPTAPN